MCKFIGYNRLCNTHSGTCESCGLVRRSLHLQQALILLQLTRKSPLCHAISNVGTLNADTRKLWCQCVWFGTIYHTAKTRGKVIVYIYSTQFFLCQSGSLSNSFEWICHECIYVYSAYTLHLIRYIKIK